MLNVIGVRFRPAGKVYDFLPGELAVKKGMHVVVETARGMEYGEVIRGPHEVEELKVIQPVRPVTRIATEEDTAHAEDNLRRQREAFRTCREKIRKHGLDMKLIDCEFTFDNSKILFYFTADGRIDFRELVKDLASVFRTRIELRQVGVRDETKLLGGLGSCGRPLCCHSYLNDFVPVSIKMAKEQNLSLNPTKISGVCGRLMCCLKNEEEVYEELNKKLPSVGDYVVTADGLNGEVQSVSILKQRVKVIVNLPNDEKEVREYQAEELTVNGRRPRGGRGRQQNSSQANAGGQGRYGAAEKGGVQERSAASDKAAERDGSADRTEPSAVQAEPERGRERRRGGRGERPAQERSERQRTVQGEQRARAEKNGRYHRERGKGREQKPSAETAVQVQPQSEGKTGEARSGRERSERQRDRRRGRGSERRGEIQVISETLKIEPLQEP